VQLYSSAENEKETVHILYKTKYGNEIGNPEFNLYVDNIPRQKKMPHFSKQVEFG
jgi:hypothetical protein